MLRRRVQTQGGHLLDGWRDELADAVRGVASGLLIGVPVVFTVDSWWLGEQVSPSDALALIAFSYVLTLVAVYWIGFRRGLRRGGEYFADALEAVALAIITLTVIFWTLGQIGDDESASIVVGRISVGLPAVSLGIAIANHLLGREMSPLNPDAGDASAERWGRFHSGWRLTLLKLAATAAGALFVSIAIVPTDELNEIATYVPIEHLPLVVALSLLVSYVVVFAAGFAGESRRRSRRHASAAPLARNPCRLRCRAGSLLACPLALPVRSGPRSIRDGYQDRAPGAPGLSCRCRRTACRMTLRGGGGRTAAEWITLAFSLLVVVSLVFIALREELTRDTGDGGRLSIEFDVDHVEFHDQNYYVPTSSRTRDLRQSCWRKSGSTSTTAGSRSVPPR